MIASTLAVLRSNGTFAGAPPLHSRENPRGFSAPLRGKKTERSEEQSVERHVPRKNAKGRAGADPEVRRHGNLPHLFLALLSRIILITYVYAEWMVTHKDITPIT